MRTRGPSTTPSARPGSPHIHRADHDRPHDEQHEDRDDRAQVEREAATPDGRQDAAEQVQIRVRLLVDEVDDRAQRRVVRDPRDPAEQDPDEDQDYVHEEEGVDVACDVGPIEREHHHRGPPPGGWTAFARATTASTASANAARTPLRSSAARPAAVTPPGEVTCRLTDGASSRRDASSAAEPAIVLTARRDAWAAVS